MKLRLIQRVQRRGEGVAPRGGSAHPDPFTRNRKENKWGLPTGPCVRSKDQALRNAIPVSLRLFSRSIVISG